MSSVSQVPTEDVRLEQAGAWCLRLAQGALEPHDKAQFEAWLAEAPENREAFEDSVGIWRATGEDLLSPTLISLRREALQSFEDSSRAQWNWLPRGVGRIAAIAACLVVVAGGVLLWSALTPAVYRTGLGERRVVVLNDGSKISLDAATEVRVRYTGNARRLWLKSGRAKFDVAKNPQRPFTVAAENRVVRATGTAFSVEILSREMRVVLYEGRVAVLATKAGGQQLVRLQRRQDAPSPGGAIKADDGFSPGQELVAPFEGAAADVRPVDPVRTLAWESGQVIFEGEPLTTAVERMNRYSEHKLKVGDGQAGSIPIDGVFNAGDTDAFIAGVTGVFPIRAREGASGTELVSRR